MWEGVTSFAATERSVAAPSSARSYTPSAGAGATASDGNRGRSALDKLARNRFAPAKGSPRASKHKRDTRLGR
jgi:hypothetical protein